MHFFVFKDRLGQWRWRLKSSNGNVIADSGEGYVNRTDCYHGITLVKTSASAKIQPNLKRSHVERALNSIFRSAKIPFECLETEFTSARAIKIPSDQVLEEASPNKFRYVIRNYDSLSNP